MALENIRIVLVAPSHGGNIGGVARAMKNMGLRHLALVAPQDFPGEEAIARAAGAEDVLEEARVFTTLDQAIADCQLVIGTSARDRRIPWPFLSPDEAARRTVTAGATQQVAILFGRERTGLTNDELDCCQALVTIPTDPAFASLNLACAVQVMAYEIRRAAADSPGRPVQCEAPLGEPVAAQAEIDRLYQHLEQVLVTTGFLDPQNPRMLMRRLMRLFNRVELTTNEVNILRGILTSVQQRKH